MTLSGGCERQAQRHRCSSSGPQADVADECFRKNVSRKMMAEGVFGPPSASLSPCSASAPSRSRSWGTAERGEQGSGARWLRETLFRSSQQPSSLESALRHRPAAPKPQARVPHLLGKVLHLGPQRAQRGRLLLVKRLPEVLQLAARGLLHVGRNLDTPACQARVGWRTVVQARWSRLATHAAPVHRCTGF